jgi:hypothetical protein
LLGFSRERRLSYVCRLRRRKEREMKKLGIAVALTLLLAVTLGAASAQAADSRLTVVNSSGTTVTVSILWSGGGVSPSKLGSGELKEVAVPGALDSVKLQVTGKCREWTETFNPQRVIRAVINCKDNLYSVVLLGPKTGTD